jgi:phosphatidylglycerol:prolipoprotein diacylglycerol transferase
MSINFPNIDPVIINIYGPIAIRWYGIAYLLGILIGLYNLYQLALVTKLNLSAKMKEALFSWLILGIVIGGRLGYVLFYGFSKYLIKPMEIFKIWEGGMSFHGGLIGVTIASYLFCKKYQIPYLKFSDLLACSAPIGIFFGRIANFINGELYGRVTKSAIGVIFPGAGELPRHASQIYEAILEGLLLFIILNIRARKSNDLNIHGKLTGLFLIFYGIFRMVAECFREPDLHVGLIYGGITMGQILSLPMCLTGILILCFWKKN